MRFYWLLLSMKSWCAEQREIWLSADTRLDLNFLPKSGGSDASSELGAGVRRAVGSSSYSCSGRRGAGPPRLSSIRKVEVADRRWDGPSGMTGGGVGLLGVPECPRGGSGFPSPHHAALLRKVPNPGKTIPLSFSIFLLPGLIFRVVVGH